MQALDGNQDLNPLTPLQRLWISEYGPDWYRRLHLVSAIRCTGWLDVELLRRSIEWMANRHGILRAKVSMAHSAAVGMNTADRLDVEVLELDMRGRALQRVVDEFRQRPFDLESGPLFRVAWARLGDQQCACILVVHHVIADGWSLGPFWSEVLQYYRLQSVPAAALRAPVGPAFQFTDAMRQRSLWLSSAGAERARAYWRSRFGSCVDLVTIPRSSRGANQEGNRDPVCGSLAAEECRRLSEAARLSGASFSSAVLAGFAVLLASWGAGRDVVAWACHTGRRRKELMKAIGCFVDMWILCVRIDKESSLRNAISAVHMAAVEALPMLDLPGIEIGREFTAIQGKQSSPVALINFLPTPSPQEGGKHAGGEAFVVEPLDVTVRERHMRTRSGIGLFATVRWDQSVLRWSFFFDPSFFDDRDVERASEFFGRVLRSMGEGIQNPPPLWCDAESQP